MFEKILKLIIYIYIYSMNKIQITVMNWKIRVQINRSNYDNMYCCFVFFINKFNCYSHTVINYKKKKKRGKKNAIYLTEFLFSTLIYVTFFLY